MLIAVADPTLKIKPQGWQKFFPNERLFWCFWPTAEAATTALEDTPVNILIVRHDMLDVAEIASLFEYLKLEAQSEARSQIGAIAVVATTKAEARPVIDELRASTPYMVFWLPPIDALFEPADDMANVQLNPATPEGQQLLKDLGTAYSEVSSDS